MGRGKNGEYETVCQKEKMKTSEVHGCTEGGHGVAEKGARDRVS